ncbi:ribonuclease P protein subunit p14 [Neosynchiropus ocellatus]
MKPSDQEEQPAVFQRVWLKKAPYQHMKVCLEVENDSTRLSADELKYFIITGLKSLHGEVGAAIDFDLLEYSEDTRTASLRVASRDIAKLWSSMTLLGFYQNQACAFRVLQEALGSVLCE